ncbi:hypothetical protein J6S35_01400 [Candidatus Saccharibacteria bacterium]|jgi:hypothetical protein|nr:hypothetical protein [Candidatus Saccharibacteria bacterium]
MSTPNINVKKKVHFAMPFEEISGGGELHEDKKVSSAVLARGRAALKLFSMGEM